MKNNVCDNSNFEEIAHLQNNFQKNIINDGCCNQAEQNTAECVSYIDQFIVNTNSHNATPQKKCYTVEDIQTMLCISRPSVYKLINKNLFHTVKVAGKHRISKKSFDNWFDNL